MLPNLLAHRLGRPAAFFLLYLTEGVPQGYATVALATQLRRLGVGTAEIGATLALVMLPWAFKWAYGPVIDVLGPLGKHGRRRGWILLTQALMVLTLLLLAGLSLPAQLGLFAAVLCAHNLCGAVQDVAIDGLACNTLAENERATAAGMMFGGQSIGVLLGGSGALFLAEWVGFQSVALFAAAVIAAVTVFVVLPMREATVATAGRLRDAGREIRRFAGEAVSGFLGSRRALAGLGFGLLPIAAMSLSLALQASLAVDLGLANTDVATLGAWSAGLTALSCVLGGLLSDRLDRRRSLAVYIVLISLPVLYLAFALKHHGWTGAGQPVSPALLRDFWIAVLAYHLAYGFIYGARAALFMDLTRPAVAATQFAVYMALTNLSIAYSAWWQGHAVEAWGYQTTLLIDAIVGISSIVFLPLMGRDRKPAPEALPA